MRNDLTELVLIVDRSGSMQSCQRDAEGGINALVEGQKKEPGHCTFTLVEFDDQYDIVQDAVPIQEAKPYTLYPRGMTAYLDAVGRTINNIGARLGNTPEHERPALVIIAIVTDGYENSSREFTAAKIKEMISHQRDVYNWQFTFLGADENAIQQAGDIGIRASAAAVYSTDSLEATYGTLGGVISASRSAVAKGAVADFNYTADDRAAMVGEEDINAVDTDEEELDVDVNPSFFGNIVRNAVYRSK